MKISGLLRKFKGSTEAVGHLFGLNAQGLPIKSFFLKNAVAKQDIYELFKIMPDGCSKCANNQTVKLSYILLGFSCDSQVYFKPRDTWFQYDKTLDAK